LIGILNATAEHLELEGISLLVPSRDIALDSGKVVIDPREGGMLIEDQSERYLDTSQPQAREFKAASASSFVCRILKDNRYPPGLLGIAAKDPAAIASRLTDIAEPLAASIEFVIERDFDALTGLPKWPVFEKHLTTAYDENDGGFVLMYFDIDRMTLANDTYGRVLGDNILRSFSKLLKTQLSDVPLARISGNYFVALLHNVTCDVAASIGKGICRELESQPHGINGRSFKATVSIGIAPLIPADDGINSALSPAKVAYDAAKDRGRGRVEVYQSPDESIVKRLFQIQLIGPVKTALEEGRMELFAQPLAHLKDPTLPPKYEVLLRMRTETGELIEPGQFLAAAERFQIMPDIDRWVVQQTLRTINQYAETIKDGTILARA
jgi:diguanylate cyclase (GGDEF)-like protein